MRSSARKRLVARFCAFRDLFKLTWPPTPLSWFDLFGFWWPQVEGKAWVFWHTVRDPDRTE